MPASNEFSLVEVSSIIVEENRQREVKDVKDLKDSIRRSGLLHPIVVTRKLVLVAGERRLRSMIELGRELIAVHYIDELSTFELKSIELEENIRRTDLTWKENCCAIADYHQLRVSASEKWTLAETGEAIGLSRSHVSKTVQVARALREGNSLVNNASGLMMASGILSKSRARAVKTEISQLDLKTKLKSPTSTPVVEEPPAKQSEIGSELIVGDFIEWVNNWTSKRRRFNFIHCDFPYGINYHKTQYRGSPAWEKYNDSPDVYFALLRTLVDNKKKIFFPSAHLMFWFAMNYYTETVQILEDGGFRVIKFPLVWTKNNVGIIPDPERGPRRTYETALIASLGDRKVIAPVANVYGCSPDKSGHITAKPRKMLEHFFRMFVDDLSEVLDPTCGSGTALAAAKFLGAKRLTGLDHEEENIKITKVSLRSTRRKRNG